MAHDPNMTAPREPRRRISRRGQNANPGAKPNGQDGGQDGTENLPLSESDCSRWVGKEPPELPFTVAGLAPKGMTTLLIADGGAGKSMLMQIALTCCPSGLPFLGMATLAGNTAGLFAEDGEAVLHVRQCRINDALDVDMETLSGRSFLKSYQGENAVLWDRDGKTAFFEELETDLKRIPDLELLVIDNAALVYADNENDRGAVTRFVNALNGLARRLGIAIILSIHTSKSSDGSLSRSASGSTAWVFAARSVLLLDAGDDAKDEPPSLTLIKANHSPPGTVVLLQWRNGVLLAAPQHGALERRVRAGQLDRLIFATVQDGWDRRQPYSSEPQARELYPKVGDGMK